MSGLYQPGPKQGHGEPAARPPNRWVLPLWRRLLGRLPGKDGCGTARVTVSKQGTLFWDNPGHLWVRCLEGTAWITAVGHPDILLLPFQDTSVVTGREVLLQGLPSARLEIRWSQ